MSEFVLSNIIKTDISVFGSLFFWLVSMLAVFRGSFRITLAEHNCLMKYWERVAAYAYISSVMFVQIATFTADDIWDIRSGPDGAWEVIWGTTGMFGAVLALGSLFSRQTYRLHLHYALLVHGFTSFICVSFVILHGDFNILTIPLVVCALFGALFVAIPPRHFQVSGHSALVSDDNNERLVLTNGLKIGTIAFSGEEMANFQKRLGGETQDILASLRLLFGGREERDEEQVPHRDEVVLE